MNSIKFLSVEKVSSRKLDKTSHGSCGQLFSSSVVAVSFIIFSPKRGGKTTFNLLRNDCGAQCIATFFSVYENFAAIFWRDVRLSAQQPTTNQYLLRKCADEDSIGLLKRKFDASELLLGGKTSEENSFG
ncbi:hypothetical protein B9Z55_025286 [Caenorhabditis nigoni]|uniref:Uncharacterized protein n=1 Tax=Caenorhabditis nigoni TaxID=1611254 RepID=A0A2G5SYD0_9PELO|nr:hypothetical protein B9Z55_025286 [Caenorhabditis nigoni]